MQDGADARPNWQEQPPRETLTGFQWRMTTPSRGMSGEQRRALDMLAGSPHGSTEGTLRAHGFTVRLLAGIVRAGLAVAGAEIVTGRHRSP
jgi:hypothetical protein